MIRITIAATALALLNSTSFAQYYSYDSYRPSYGFSSAAMAVPAISAQAHAGPLPLDRGAYAKPPNEDGIISETVQYRRGVFEFPRAGDAIIDWCVFWARDCGWGGAHQFCRSNGFDHALTFDVFRPGRTYVIGSNKYCVGETCTGFRFVTCT
jgi:hypothetical protein